jgi:hypothetical protein
MTGTSPTDESCSGSQLVQVVDDGPASAGPMTLRRSPRRFVRARMIERDGGDPGIVERVAEAVVATRVLGCTVRDKNSRSGMVDRPPACEHLDPVGIDDRPLLHRNPLRPPRPAVLSRMR